MPTHNTYHGEQTFSKLKTHGTYTIQASNNPRKPQRLQINPIIIAENILHHKFIGKHNGYSHPVKTPYHGKLDKNNDP